MSRFYVSCSSSNLIYCITCKRCGIQYVGQTKRALKMRLSEHFLKVTNNDPESEIGGHFNSDHHSGLDDISVHVIDFVHAAPHTQLKSEIIERPHRIQLDSETTHQCPFGFKCYGSPEIITSLCHLSFTLSCHVKKFV